MDPSPWILVIDDDRWTREALVSILRRAGYQVTPRERFDQELEAGHFPQRYQVAVLDYHLPRPQRPGGGQALETVPAGLPHRHDFFRISQPARTCRPGSRGRPVPGQTLLQGRHSGGNRPALPRPGDREPRVSGRPQPRPEIFRRRYWPISGGSACSPPATGSWWRYPAARIRWPCSIS